jgi:hypothetical protein
MTEARKAKKFNDMIDYIEKFESICYRMFTFPQPTVAAIEGHAIAGGTVLASACDFRISNGKGNFGMNEVINGLTLPFQMLEIFRFAVPSQSSWHMFMTGEVFGAKKALELGVVKEIVTPEQVRFFFFLSLCILYIRNHKLRFINSVAGSSCCCGDVLKTVNEFLFGYQEINAASGGRTHGQESGCYSQTNGGDLWNQSQTLIFQFAMNSAIRITDFQCDDDKALSKMIIHHEVLGEQRSDTDEAHAVRSSKR